MEKSRGVFVEIGICIAVVVLAASLCFLGRSFLSYRTDALILLMTLSVLAMFFGIWAVMIASVLSALTWNFFFIPPTFTFHIGNAEDSLMFLMYFLIAVINAILTYKIKRERKKNHKKDEEETVNR